MFKVILVHNAYEKISACFLYLRQKFLNFEKSIYVIMYIKKLNAKTHIEFLNRNFCINLVIYFKYRANILESELFNGLWLFGADVTDLFIYMFQLT